MLQVQPRLSDIHALIDKVPSYPTSAQQLVELAILEHAPPEVVDFYQAFPGDEVFTSKDDLLARSEHIEIMHREEDQPAEILTAPEED